MNPTPRSDWRLQGQEKYMQGAAFVFRRYAWPKSPEWDHDHCEFCGGKFSAEAKSGALHDGYATKDERWVCHACFQDFRSALGFTIQNEERA